MTTNVIDFPRARDRLNARHTNLSRRAQADASLYATGTPLLAETLAMLREQVDLLTELVADAAYEAQWWADRCRVAERKLAALEDDLVPPTECPADGCPF